MGYPVGGMGGDGRIATGQLVSALCTCFDESQLALDGAAQGVQAVVRGLNVQLPQQRQK